MSSGAWRAIVSKSASCWRSGVWVLMATVAIKQSGNRLAVLPADCSSGRARPLLRGRKAPRAGENCSDRVVAEGRARAVRRTRPRGARAAPAQSSQAARQSRSPFLDAGRPDSRWRAGARSRITTNQERAATPAQLFQVTIPAATAHRKRLLAAHRLDIEPSQRQIDRCPLCAQPVAVHDPRDHRVVRFYVAACHVYSLHHARAPLAGRQATSKFFCRIFFANYGQTSSPGRAAPLRASASRNSGSSRTDSTLAAAEPIGGRPPRRHRVSSRS